ncbi:MAG: cyanophycinase [bacterium]|nr:cyanophycinase [bacterium]
MTAKKIGNGTLVAIGGKEDKRDGLEILRRVIDEGKGRDTHIEVVTTASREPKPLARVYRDTFRRIGISRYEVINIASREEANSEALSKRMAEADIIFFTGGDQLRLTSILGGSRFLKTLRECYEHGTMIAGTSAGAAAISDTMIYGGESRYGLVKSKVSMSSGFGFIKNVVFDTHFIGRGRIIRLFQVVASNPANVGVGLSEDTAIIMRDEYIMEVIGNGIVIVVDGSHLRNSNISHIGKGDLIAAENFHVHSLIAGYKYNLKTKRVIVPDQHK